MLNASSLLVLAAVLGGAGSAQAADLAPVYKGRSDRRHLEPVAVRVRALGVLPDASGSSVNVAGSAALSSPNSGLSIGNAVVPELDISYFFTQNIAAELILGVTPHHITGTGALAGVDIGKTWLLPPTLMLQYHFTNFGAFQPYIGVGVELHRVLQHQRRQYGVGGLAVTQTRPQQRVRRGRPGRLRLHDRPPLGCELRRQEAVPRAELHSDRQQRDRRERTGQHQSVAGRRRHHLPVLIAASDRCRARPGVARVRYLDIESRAPEVRGAASLLEPARGLLQFARLVSIRWIEAIARLAPDRRKLYTPRRKM